VDTLEVVWPTGETWDTVLVDADRTVTITEYDISGIATPGKGRDEFRLLACQPNPFKGSTTISYSLAESSPVELRVYDVAGRVVSRPVSSQRAATA
jgi:hypothetical protein